MIWLKRFGNTTKAFWDRLKIIIQELKFIVVNLFILSIIILISYAIIREINNDNIIFNVADIPQELIDRGLTSSVFAKKVVDEVNYIKEVSEDSLSNKTIPNEKMPLIITLNSSPDINFEIPKTGLYFSSIVNFFRRYFNKEVSSINSEITINHKTAYFTLRHNNSIIYARTSLDSIGKGIQSIALDLLKELQPLSAANYLIKKRKYIECDRFIKRVSYKLTNIQLSQAYCLLGIISKIEKREVKADLIISQAIKIDSSNILAYCLLYEFRSETGKSNNNEFLLKKALSIPNKSAYNYYYIGSLIDVKGDLLQAETLYKKALLINPKLVPAIYDLAYLKEQQEKYVEAENLYLNILKLKPYDLDAYNAMGRLLSDQNRLKEAEEFFNDAKSINNRDYSSYIGLGIVKYKQGNLYEAKKQFLYSLKLSPKNVFSLNYLGHIYTKIGKSNKAEYYFRKALKIDSHNSEAYYYLGVIKYNQNKYKQAEKMFVNAIKFNPSDTNSAKALINIREQMYLIKGIKK